MYICRTSFSHAIEFEMVMKQQSVILVKNICDGTFTNADGYALFLNLTKVLDVYDTAVLSFSGIDAVSSSFLNSSIGAIIDQKGLEILKNRIKITNYTPALAGAIKVYVSQYKHRFIC